MSGGAAPHFNYKRDTLGDLAKSETRSSRMPPHTREELDKDLTPEEQTEWSRIRATQDEEATIASHPEDYTKLIKAKKLLSRYGRSGPATKR